MSVGGSRTGKARRIRMVPPALCRELYCFKQGKPFPLSGRTAGLLLGVPGV